MSPGIHLIWPDIIKERSSKGNQKKCVMIQWEAFNRNLMNGNLPICVKYEYIRPITMEVCKT